MKKIIALLLTLLMVVSLVACSGDKDKGKGETVDVTLTVWGPAEDQGDESKWLDKMCKQFNEEHPEWNITFKLGVCPEGDAGKNVSQDPSAAADVYMFANDQLGMLIQANAIARLGGSVESDVKSNNSQAMLNTVTVDGALYGVPFTGNTWFMYYDKSVFTEEDVKSLDTMLQKGKVSFPLTNSWYLPAFYFSNGGTLFGPNGDDASAGVQLGGDAGTAVTKYLVNLVKNPNFSRDDSGSGIDGLRNGNVNAMFSGTWDAANVKEALGDNYAAAQLPCITIDGQQKQLRAYYGSKAIGVNPNCKNMPVATALAAYLGSEKAQLEHYKLRNVIPCLNSLLNNAEVAADPAALAQANCIANTSFPQPYISEMSSCWDPVTAMGNALFNGEVTEANAAEKTKAFNDSMNNSGV